MAARRQNTARKGIVAKIAAVACASTLAAGCLSFGMASAGNVFDANSSNVISATQIDDTQLSAPAESLVLENAAKRDISRGVEEIAQEEEAARIAAEEAARAEERRLIAAAADAQAKAAAAGAPALDAVDFSIGKEAFIAEWSTRIDIYLAGSPLAGYGSVFAEAAWNNSVDPRWSPAISNTESTKGRNCFRAYNAWGWMAESWTSWNEAINAHVSGLARGYGYTISVANAKKYCPPTYMDWYAKTVAEMAKI